MQKNIIHIFLIILLPYIGKACNSSIDTNQHFKSVYLEVLGIGGYGSLNYEHQLYEYQLTKIRLRAGISTYHLKDYEEKFNPDLLFPFACYALIGYTHSLELGFGTTLSSTIKANYLFIKKRNWNMHSNLSIGYRYEHKHFLFRLTYSPLLEKYRYWRNWAGISLGYIPG